MPSKKSKKGRAARDEEAPSTQGPGRSREQERASDAPSRDSQPSFPSPGEMPSTPQPHFMPSPQGSDLPPDVMKSMTGLTLTSQPPQFRKKIPAASRQPPGTQGRKIGLVANYFILKCKDISIYHYDIDIVFVGQRRKEEGDGKPKQPKKGKSVFEEGRTAKQAIEKDVSHVEHQQTRAPGKQRCREIITKMCEDEKLVEYYPVYDGQKNLYTTKMLNIKDKTGQKFKIELVEDKIKQFEITIKPVEKKGGGNLISLEPLRELYRGNRSKEIPQEVIMAFDTVMCHRNPPFLQTQVGRSFFLLNDKRDALGEGLEIWYGYNQSVHLTQRGPAVIVNFAAKAFHKEGNVVDCASYILEQDITKIPRLEPYQVKQLEEALSKVKVQVKHQKYPRKYPVKGLTRTSAKETRFKVDDKTEMSVADYFKQAYKPLKYPHLPCLHMRTGKNTYMPMEVCYIYPGQPKLGKLSGKMTSKMIKQTAIPPKDRFYEIQDSVKLIEQVSGQLMSKFGLLLELKFMQFEGRVIGAPKLAYKPSNERPSIAEPDNRGTWKMDGKQFFRSKQSISWILLSFSSDRFCKRENLTRFAETLCNCARQLGMNLERPKDTRIFNLRDKTFSALKYAKDANVTFAVVVLSSRDSNHSYEEVKFVTEIQLKLLTQCMNDTVVVNKFNPQVATNVLLKINSKLGGVNHTLNQRPVVFSRPVIVFGADAAHSPRGYLCPSIASVVGSLDAYPARYAVTCRVQQNPDKKKLSQEIIVELEAMVKEILQAFLRNTNGKKPEKIIFFRDGVSEGQFNVVLENEIEAIQLACKAVLDDHIPPITFIVVQKRHQTRLRPQNPKDGVGRPGNVPPGTVADTDIVHPVFFDFFLCSHEGIQGTSKPAHYTVLFDENKMTSDELQKLCYHLCHMYVRCNRSISVPAPVMYADLACTRAKKYADWYIKTHEQSVSSDSSDEIRPLPDEMVAAITNMKNFEAGMFYV